MVQIVRILWEARPRIIKDVWKMCGTYKLFLSSKSAAEGIDIELLKGFTH